MGRPKIKESKALTVRLEKSLYDRLSSYCEESGQPKTVAVERALEMYIDDYDEKMKKIMQK